MKSILLVEDEEQLRASFAQTISTSGEFSLVAAVASGGIRITQSRDELEKLLRFDEKSPEGLSRLQERFVRPLDGKAGERVARAAAHIDF